MQSDILLAPPVMNALRTVPCHSDVINVHELLHFVRGLKNNKDVGNDGIPSEVYKFASERLLTICVNILAIECTEQSLIFFLKSGSWDQRNYINMQTVLIRS